MSRQPATLNEALDRAAAVPGTGLRLLDRRERETWLPWSAVADGARRVAAGLQSAGVRKGDRIALIYPTGRDFFEAFFGALLAGAVPVPLYPPVRLGRADDYRRRTMRMLRAAGVRLVLGDARMGGVLDEAVREDGPSPGCTALDALPGGAWREPRVADDELGLVQFSSGTTVEPKPVALSHRAILAQARLLNGLWPDDERVTHSGVSWLPLYHDMGLIGCVMPALERPAVLTLLSPEAFAARPALWLRAISRYRATVSPAPNFAYAMCVHRIRDEELNGVDLSSWRAALNGAEVVVPSVLRAFAERFSRWGFRPEAMTPVYGLSEAALAVTFSPLGTPPRTQRFDRQRLASGIAVLDPDGIELVSVGRPLPGFEIRIVGEDGAELEDGRVGTVWIRGPSLMDRYLGQPARTASVLRGGWLDTGDLGFLQSGELFLHGREKDILLLRGRNHAPEEVETALDGVPGTRPGRAVAVSWLPEDAESEELVVFVEAHRAIPPSEYPGLAESCAAAVPRVCGLVADRVVVLDHGTLPQTSSGKLRRRETLRLWLAGRLCPPRSSDPARLAGTQTRSTSAQSR